MEFLDFSILDYTIIFLAFVLTSLNIFKHSGYVKNLETFAISNRKFGVIGSSCALAINYCAYYLLFFYQQILVQDLSFHLFNCGMIAIFIFAGYFVSRKIKYINNENISLIDNFKNLIGKYNSVGIGLAVILFLMLVSGAQLKFLALAVSFLLKVNPFLIITTSILLATIYTYNGGIRAVIFNNSLFVAIFILASFILLNILSEGKIINAPFHNITHFQAKFSPWLGYLFFFISPLFNPAIFSLQLKKHDFSKHVLSLLIFTSIILSLFYFNNILDKNLLINLKKYRVIDGSMGLVITMLIVITIGSVASHIQAAAVIGAREVLSFYKLSKMPELKAVKLVSMIIGLIIFYLSFKINNLDFALSLATALYLSSLGLAIISYNIPLTLDKKAILSGFCTNIVFLLLKYNTVFDIMLSVAIALIVMLAIDSFIKDRVYFRLKEFYFSADKFTILQRYFTRLCPKDEAIYATIGFYFLVFGAFIVFSTRSLLLGDAHDFVLASYQVIMITATFMACYFMWPRSLKPKYKIWIIRIWWIPALFYILGFYSILFTIASGFKIQLYSFAITNIVLIYLLLGVRYGTAINLIALIAALKCYYNYFGPIWFNPKVFSVEYFAYAYILPIVAYRLWLKGGDERKIFQKHILPGTLKLNVLNIPAKYIDYGSGTYRRECFDDYYRDMLWHHIAAFEPLSMVVVEIDHTAEIVRDFGLKNHDFILQQLAAKVNISGCKANFIAKLGYNQLVVMYYNADLLYTTNDAKIILDFINKSEFVTDEGQKVHFTCSIGVAQLEHYHDNVDSLLSKTCGCATKAADMGKNCVINNPMGRFPNIAKLT